MIHIGDKLGAKYDFIRYYVPFRLKYRIKFSDYRKHGEVWKYPKMYVKQGFVPKENEIVFDVGAQYGDYSLVWEKHYKATVFAFELLVQNYTEMMFDLKLNNSRINAYRMAIGNGEKLDFETRGTMAVKSADGSSWITSVKLDDFVYRNQVIPNFIKIDVEGFELDVLEGAKETLSKYHPRIIIETHSRSLRKSCDKFLTNLDYGLWYKGRTVKGSDWMDEVANLFYGSD